jgi:hypothetical protein
MTQVCKNRFDGELGNMQLKFNDVTRSFATVSSVKKPPKGGVLWEVSEESTEMDDTLGDVEHGYDENNETDADVVHGYQESDKVDSDGESDHSESESDDAYPEGFF